MRAALIAALVSASLALGGCASTPAPASQIEGALPAQAMIRCEPLPPLEDLSTEAKSAWILVVAPSYAACANKVRALADWINGGRTAPPSP